MKFSFFSVFFIISFFAEKVKTEKLPSGKEKRLREKHRAEAFRRGIFFCVEFFRKIFFPIVKKLKIRMKISRTYCIFRETVIYCSSDKRLCPWFVTKKDVPYGKVLLSVRDLSFCQAVDHTVRLLSEYRKVSAFAQCCRFPALSSHLQM